MLAFYRKAFSDAFDYSRGTGRLWHSNLDQELRLTSVLQNNCIHKKLLPGVNTEELSLEEAAAIIKKRESLGYFGSFEEARASGFEF